MNNSISTFYLYFHEIVIETTADDNTTTRSQSSYKIIIYSQFVDTMNTVEPHTLYTQK